MPSLHPRYTSNGRFIPGEGPVPCPGMIVGEAPGYDESLEGHPFVGASGRLLNHALSDAGVDRAEVYVTNAYKIRPDGNRNPTREELLSHRPYLCDELSGLCPIGVLALGNVALETLTGLSGISRNGGVWLPLSPDLLASSPDTEVIGTYHPSYVLRQGGQYSDAGIRFWEDVQTFVNRTLRLV